MRSVLVVLTVAAVLLLAVPASAAIDGASAPSAGSLIPRLYKNCTNLNKRYPHGLGKRFARDKTSGTPVRNFYRSTRLYKIAMSYNAGLDRDKDGIACEKR
jgi:hypothetical protein